MGLWAKFLGWLDARRLPQRLVSGLLSRRSRARARPRHPRPYSASEHEGVHAVGLGIANPLVAHQALLADFVPRSFGSWRDYGVVRCVVGQSLVVAILKDRRTGLELSLVMPRHGAFPVRRFRRSRQVRLTREGLRSGLVSVRDKEGRLLAAGVLEARERAGYSYPYGAQP